MKEIRQLLGFPYRLLTQGTCLYLADLSTIQYRHLYSIKNKFLRLSGMRIDEPIFIDRGFKCINPKNIEIEKYVSLGHDNHIWAFNSVKIGRYVQTAKDLLIISGSHDVASYENLTNQDVVIGAGCWIGARVTILGGVKIGKGCVIGACSLVKNDIPDWSVAVGIPAKIISKRIPAEKIKNPFCYYSPEEISN